MGKGFGQLFSGERGRALFGSRFVQAPGVNRLQELVPFVDVAHVLRAARWGAYLLAVGLVGFAFLELGPTSQQRFVAAHKPGPQLGWVVSDVVGLVTAFVFALALVYAGRHVPFGAHYPSCQTCGRVRETLFAHLRGSRLCTGCGRVLRGEIRVAERRTFDTL